jgi:hypothetical protein
MRLLYARTLFGAVLCAGLLGVQVHGPSWLEYGLEYALIASALALVWAGWGRALVTQVPRSARPLALVLPLLVTAGAVIKSPHTLYPFVSWGMFGRTPSGVLVQYRLFATDVRGERRLMPGAGVSDVAASSLDGHLRRTMEASRGATERDDAARLIAGIERLEAAARGRPVTVSRLERCVTSASAPTALHCEPVPVPTLPGPR